MAALMGASAVEVKEENTKEIIRVPMTEALSEAVAKHRKSKEYKDAAKALDDQAGKKLKEYGRGHGSQDFKSNPQVKQYAFETPDHTAWINLRPNGYGKMSDGMVEEVKGATSDEFVKKHVGIHISGTINFSQIPAGKQNEVAAHLMALNHVVYGPAWEPTNAQPSLVAMKKETKPLSTFHQARFTELDDTESMLLDDLVPQPVAFSGKDGRKK